MARLVDTDKPEDPGEPNIFRKRRFRTRKDSEDRVNREVDSHLRFLKGESLSPTKNMYPSEVKSHFGPSDEEKKRLLNRKR